jgi:hypothetical protein
MKKLRYWIRRIMYLYRYIKSKDRKDGDSLNTFIINENLRT